MNRTILPLLGFIVAMMLFMAPRLARADNEDEETSMIPANSPSHNALDLIRNEEGLRLNRYRDGGGWSIGWGHYLGTETDIETIDEGTAEQWLFDDVETAAQLIRSHVTVPLSQNQFDALTSFVYNLGPRAFQGEDGQPSTWLRLINSGDYNGAKDQLTRWVHSRGQYLPVLARRREREQSLFMA